MEQIPELLGQKATSFPQLLEGESILFETGQSIPPLLWLGFIVLTIVPPFFIGPLLLGLTWWSFNGTRIVLTNKRFVSHRRTFWGTSFVYSIPIARVKVIDRLNTDIIHLLSGVSRVSVTLEGTLLRATKISCVRNAKELIRQFNTLKAAAKR